MFGRKSNQIKALRATLEIKDRTLVNRFELLKIKNDELQALTLQRDELQAQVQELQAKLSRATAPKPQANPPEENIFKPD